MSGREERFAEDELLKPVAAGDSDKASEDEKDYETHPDAEKLFKSAPFLKKIPIFGKCVDAFGPKLVIALGATNALTKGAAGYIIYNSMQPIFSTRYDISGERYNRLSSLYTMGWSLKCFIAPISDIFPVFGYSKRWYCLVSALAGGCFAFGYGLMPAASSSGDAAAAFLFLTSMGKANVDILLQSLYSREMRRAPSAGSELVSWVWWMIFLGDFVTLIQGPLSDAGVPHVGVIVSACLQIIPAIFFFMNWFGEKPNKVERLEDAQRNFDEQFAREDMTPALVEFYHYARVEFYHYARKFNHYVRKFYHYVRKFFRDDQPVPASDFTAVPEDQPVPASDFTAVPEAHEWREGEYTSEGPAEGQLIPFQEPRIRTYLNGVLEVNTYIAVDNYKVVAYCALMTAAVIVLAVVTLLGNSWDLLWCCIAIVVVVPLGAYCALPLAIANASIMVYLVFLLYLNFPGALSYFYLAKPDCVPNGPNFSYTFYLTVINVITYAAGMLGSILFTPIFSRRRYQATFAITTLLQVIASLVDLIMLERWNIAVGIPDHAMYICGDAIIYEIVHVMTFMPVMVLISRLVPRGSESMVYSLTAGFTNLGESMAYSFGSILMEFRFPVKNKVPCNFSNARYLIIIGHLCMPLAIIPLSFLLLPNCRVCDNVDIHGKLIKKPRRAQPVGSRPRSPPEKAAGAADAEEVMMDDHLERELGAKDEEPTQPEMVIVPPTPPATEDSEKSSKNVSPK